tara:strand:+ start:3756 stop:3938 length:183 start_codon:yes stop_codon:yes gene_type:complete
MPFPMKQNIGSETGIEAEKGYASEDYIDNRISDKKFDWLARIRNIFINLWDIIKIVIKWR